MLSTNRREFLAATVSTTAALATSRAALAVGAGSIIDDSPLFEISLAQWSLHRMLRGGEMDHLDFAKAAREDFGIGAVEYVSSFFKDKARDEKYLGQMDKRCKEHDVKSVLIMVDGEGALGAPSDDARAKTVDNHHKWVDAAKFLGCHSIRVNAQSSGSYQEQVRLAADGLARLSEYAARQNINVIVENHGGLSSNGQWLAQVIRKVNMDNCGTLPDFGNFTIKKDKSGPIEVYDRYLGMASLMPFAKAVSAKSRDFDEAGNEAETDFMKMLQIMLDAGYRGYVGIEYEGRKLGEKEGVIATKTLLEKCRTELAKTYAR